MSSVESLLVEIRQRLLAQEFNSLLIESLGWDNPGLQRAIIVEVDGGLSYSLKPVATKRGMTVFHCANLPDSKAMAKIDREVSKQSLERLIIYSNDDRQLWRWPEARKSGGTRFVSHGFASDSPAEPLVQRLASVQFSLAEERSLNILGVLQRVRLAFNSDEVTGKFYREYQASHEMLTGKIKGLKSSEEKSWYSSLMLNRLMFIYFMQKKGFLNNDVHYLRQSLIEVRVLQGENKFYKYYSNFLLPLFHEGLGSEEEPNVDSKISAIIGDVPYVNGGIFAKHSLEETRTIDIPDSAFEHIFTFLDHYRWHLDERTVAIPGEINPEVLGYIFEKYVNQKQQGAYYTKEDVTGYMVASTIAPVIIERLLKISKDNPWQLIVEQPLRYISASMRFGMGEPIPNEIREASQDKFGKLDEIADQSFGLPGERWRETLDRHSRVIEIVDMAQRGEIASCEGVLAHNLDVLMLIVDWVASFQEPTDVFALWCLLKSLNILDPTCGSGAFLFAAADVLEEIYEVTLSRARELVVAGIDTPACDLKAVVEEIKKHPSEGYFRLKTIVLENIYGVDIMAEAVEIARLRLFLTLVARLDRRDEIEPLPDLDMNIKVGNTLVGCSTFEDAEIRFSESLLAMQALFELKPQVAELTESYNKFITVQRNSTSGAKLSSAKVNLMQRTALVRANLDQLFASETGVSPAKFDKWKESHIPFHWFVEFPEAMSSGGFDVVIGNPPYIKRADVMKQYQIVGFRSGELYDIFAPCMERSVSLLTHDGAFSMIVPIAFQFSDEYGIIREVLTQSLPVRFVSAYSRNPASLFDASVGVRSTIVSGLRLGSTALYTSSLRRWVEPGRKHLFATTRFAKSSTTSTHAPWPRLGTKSLAEFYATICSRNSSIGHETKRGGDRLGFKQTALYYLSIFVDDPPSWTLSGRRIPQTKIGNLYFETGEKRNLGFILLSGRLGCWWWATTGDDFDLTTGLLERFPIGISDINAIKKQLLAISRQLQMTQPKHPLVTKYAGKEMGNYDMSRCRHITDKADLLVLQHLGLSKFWPEILLADAWLAKATGERHGTRREWPFPL